MNAELRRNLWLEFSVTRVVLMPAILGLVLAIAAFGDHTANVARTMMGILLILWGTRLAADAVLAEVAERTWDAQRSAAMGPAAMTFGKLLGATSYTWYGALLCLPFAALPPTGSPILTLDMAMTACLAQALALLASLVILRLRPVGMRLPATFAQLTGLGVAILFLTIVPQMGGLTVNWGGYAFNGQVFGLATLACAAFWAVIGCWRLMREELQFRNGPIIWLAFVLFWMIYFAQLGHGPDTGPFVALTMGASATLYPAFAVAVLSGLLITLAEPKGIGPLRAFFHAVATRQPRAILADMPGWVWNALAALVLAALIATNPHDRSLVANDRFLPLLVLCFALRDIALIHFVTLSGTARSHFACLLYLAVLYVGFPTLLTAAGNTSALALFWPLPQENSPLALWSRVPGNISPSALWPLAEAAVFVGLFLWRYGKAVRTARLAPA